MTNFEDIYDRARQEIFGRLYGELMRKHNGILICGGDFLIKHYDDVNDCDYLTEVTLKNLTCLEDGEIMVDYNEKGDTFSDPIEMFSLDEIDGILSVIKDRL